MGKRRLKHISKCPKFGTSGHLAIAKAGDRYWKMDKAKRSEYGCVGKYLQAQVGHLLGDTPQGVRRDWTSLLKRARAVRSVVVAKLEVKRSKKEARVARERQKLQDALGDDLDEEEFLSDLGGWVVKILLWISNMVPAIVEVKRINVGMTHWSSAHRILEALGCGNRFVSQMLMRSLQPFGFCQGHILLVGTGTHVVIRRLCKSETIDLSKTLLFYLALEPMLRYLVACTLGPSWAQLVTFQMWQSLMCERRKADDETRERRPGHAEREKQYLDNLWPFLEALGISKNDRPSNRRRPVICIPDWADKAEVRRMLDILVALLIRFAELVLKRKSVPVLLASGGVLRRSEAFQNARLCQWHHALDRGSLVNFNLGLVPAIEKHVTINKCFGWIHKQDFLTVLPDKVWNDLLPQAALAATILADGTARSQAGDLDVNNLSSLASSQVEYKFPYGRALNGVTGVIDDLLTGNWKVRHDNQ